jgi:hypothetical protein
MYVKALGLNSTKKNLSDDLSKTFDQLKREQEQDPLWQKNNLEYDLRNTQWVIDKAKANQVYAQNIYAAICNNQFIRLDVWQLLKEEYWTASWRDAGGIVADILGEGDYIDWYCSGSGGPLGGMTVQGYLPEGVVSDEIEDDFLQLGWKIIPYAD